MASKNSIGTTPPYVIVPAALWVDHIQYLTLAETGNMILWMQQVMAEETETEPISDAEYHARLAAYTDLVARRNTYLRKIGKPIYDDIPERITTRPKRGARMPLECGIPTEWQYGLYQRLNSIETYGLVVIYAFAMFHSVRPADIHPDGNRCDILWTSTQAMITNAINRIQQAMINDRGRKTHNKATATNKVAAETISDQYNPNDLPF